jgi:hypothetical protein
MPIDSTTSSFSPGQTVGNRFLVQGPEKRVFGKQRYTAWLTRCPCGEEKWVPESYLRHGRYTFGCIKCATIHSEGRDFRVGKSLGSRVIVAGPEYRRDSKHLRKSWLIRCQCGRELWRSETAMRKATFPGKCPSCSQIKASDYAIGTAYGLRKIVGGPLVVKQSNGKGYKNWILECKCGNRASVRESDMRNDRAKNGCPSCAREEYHTPHTSVYSESLDGLRGWRRHLWTRVVHGATKRGIEVSITWQEGFLLMEQQAFRCAYTGRKLTLPVSTDWGRYRKCTASLDRIDSAKGYEPGNVQWVEKRINLMKRDIPHDAFVRLCKIVARRFPRNKEGNPLPLAND